MKGCRPLDTNEIIKIAEQFDGVFEVRNRSLFMLGVSVGGRISELLALKIEDVWQNEQAVTDLLFQKDIVKGKETARMIPVNGEGRQAIIELRQWQEQLGHWDKRRPVFPSRKPLRAISRGPAQRSVAETEPGTFLFSAKENACQNQTADNGKTRSCSPKHEQTPLWITHCLTHALKTTKLM